MISYVLHKIKEVDGESLNKTVLLDSDKRRIVGVFAIVAGMYQAQSYQPSLSIGLKYNGHEVLPPNFPIDLITHKGLMPLRDSMLPTTYEVPKEDKNGIVIDVNILNNLHRGIPDIDLYFVTEK